MKRLYNYFRLLACCAVFTTTYAQQNLVLNPSFEDVNEENILCGFMVGGAQYENAVNFWTIPNTGSTDIHHMSLEPTCINHPLSTNPSSPGNQLPRTGDSMTGIIMVSPNSTLNSREYVQGELSEPLIVGIPYLIQFYVSKADYSQFASNNFGIKFFTAPYFQNSWNYINVTPDANYTEVITDTENWVLVELEFTPDTPGLIHFIIGNFFDNEDTIYEEAISSPVDINAYYYLDDVSITMALPVFEQLGPFCRGESFTLPEISENEFAGTWSPEINNQETTTYTFTPDNPDMSEITMTIEITEPYIDAEFNMPTSFCKGTDFTLPEVSENGYAGTWSPEINNQETTTYTFTPEEGHCVLETSVTIEIIEPTNPTFNNIDLHICKGADYSLPIISENGITGTWHPAFDNQQTTTYTFVPDDEFCAAETSVTIEIIQPTELYLEYYCFQDDLFVTVLNTDTSSYTFNWKINGNTVNENTNLLNVSENTNLLNSQSNTISVDAIDENGCISSANSIDIANVENICMIPKGISPNGDNLNDELNLEFFGKVYLQIFNNYGTKVYENSNYTNQWHGQSNAGNLLPTGTYYYQVQTLRGETFTGWIQLIYEIYD